jgi:hypothetical protein
VLGPLHELHNRGIGNKHERFTKWLWGFVPGVTRNDHASGSLPSGADASDEDEQQDTRKSHEHGSANLHAVAEP